MKEPTDEQLMSSADGELDAETERWVASVVAQRPDLAHKVAIYRATGRGLGDIVGQGLADKPDDTLERHILAHPIARPGAAAADRTNGAAAPKIAAAAEPPARGGTVVQFPGRASARSSRRPATLNLALAAGVAALVAGALAMTMLEWRSASPGGTPGTTVAGKTIGNRETGKATSLSVAALAGALEIAPSNKAMAVAGGWTVEPVLTFAARDGRYCREYLAVHASGNALSGVACRAGSANWQTTAQAPVEGSLPDAGAGTKPADRPSPPPAVEDEIRRLQGQDALDGRSEAELMSRGWK